MDLYTALGFAHLLCFVYWLGGDLGVFYSSRFLQRSDLSAEARRVAGRIMMGLDQGPRICMTLIAAPGVHMAAHAGWLPLSAGWLAAIWALSLGWLAMVLLLHFGPRLGAAAAGLAVPLAKVDFGFRAVLALGLGGFAIGALLAPQSGPPLVAPWLAVKLLVFAALVGCGLGIRIALRPFGPAFAALQSGPPSPEHNLAIAQSLAHCRPLVLAIWAGLLLNAALGLHLL
ncbi:MAG: hypothetical protein OXU92_01080 [Deltaproteobacteria bacterium]|nr:hypothetical protein [Deltaproteobacteria bacterium]MDD9873554.1 hypothetical protein [Deltaproteobacteria bacterium]